eukprot:3245886-Amphidinium_carterae.1
MRPTTHWSQPSEIWRMRITAMKKWQRSSIRWATRPVKSNAPQYVYSLLVESTSAALKGAIRTCLF